MIRRYSLPEMSTLWLDKRSKFAHWLIVELAVVEAMQELGLVSKRASMAIKRHAGFDVERIEQIEEATQHDMIAFVTAVHEVLEGAGAGRYKEFFHKLVTSYDIEDAATILMLRRAIQLCIAELAGLRGALRGKAVEHAWTSMIARTHGQAAQPDTFGRLLLIFDAAIERSIVRLSSLLETELAEASISGAVGNYLEVPPDLEAKALEKLGLRTSKAETQIVQRDRHAAVMSACAIAGASIEQIAKTFWVMMRTECGELREGRKVTQKGSSAMPHKRNPILTERLMGQARILRANCQVAFENVATFDCREISQSSTERIIFADSTTLLHYMANKATGLVQKLEVNAERMARNLSGTYGVWASQRVRNALMSKRVSYPHAYDHVQKLSFQAFDGGIPLIDILRTEKIVGDAKHRTALAILGEDSLANCFDLKACLAAGVLETFRRAGLSLSE